jgi:hypothetical protein
MIDVIKWGKLGPRIRKAAPEVALSVSIALFTAASTMFFVVTLVTLVTGT